MSHTADSHKARDQLTTWGCYWCKKEVATYQYDGRVIFLLVSHYWLMTGAWCSVRYYSWCKWAKCNNPMPTKKSLSKFSTKKNSDLTPFKYWSLLARVHMPGYRQVTHLLIPNQSKLHTCHNSAPRGTPSLMLNCCNVYNLGYIYIYTPCLNTLAICRRWSQCGRLLDMNRNRLSHYGETKLHNKWTATSQPFSSSSKIIPCKKCFPSAPRVLV